MRQPLHALSAGCGGLIAFLFGGCDPGTAVQIVVQGELRVPDEVRTLEFHVVSDRGERFDGTYEIDTPFPHTLTLLPRDPAAAVEVTVLARDSSGDAVVTRVARTQFTAGQDRDVFLCLERACMRVSCAGGEVCRGGACGAPPSDDGSFRPGCVAPTGSCAADADCDDRFFCNGAERCVSGECVPGAAPTCDDGVACTRDSCDEAADACVHRPNDADCSDGLACNGLERCDASGGCMPGTAVACDDGDACTVDACTEPGGRCTHARLDADGDGRPAMACGGDDCDDGNASVRPGAPEFCNAADDDCDGMADEELYAASAPAPLSNVGAAPSAVALAHDGDAFGVAWAESPVGVARIRFARVGADGTFVLMPRTLSDPAVESRAPALAYSGASYGVAWTEAGARVRFQRVRRSGGDPIGAAVIFDEGDVTAPAVAWDGARFAIAWGGPSLRFATVASDGTAGTPITVATAAGRIERIALAPAASGVAVAWVEAESARVAVVAPDGSFATAPTTVALPGARVIGVDLAAGDGELALAYQDAATSFPAARLVRIDEAGAVRGAPATLSALGRNTAVRLARRSGEWASTWQWETGGVRRLVLRRVRGDGVPFAASIDVAADIPAVTSTALADGGTNIGVVLVQDADGDPRVVFVAVGCAS